MNPSVTWFEIPVSDLERAIPFYEQVFGILLERRTIDGYRMALFPLAEGGPGASGALVEGDVYVPGKAGPILYFRVESIVRVLERVVELQGRILYPAKVLDDGGSVAEFEDSEGNRIALQQEASPAGGVEAGA